MRVLLSWAILVLALAGGSPALAESDEASDGSVPEWAEDGRNEIAIFIGVTDVADDPGPSLGLDYEYRFSRPFGLGGTIEWTGADLREGLVVVSFDWHVWKEMKLFIAPGVEIETRDGTDLFVVRIGIEYGFDIGKGWEIAPSLNFDFTSEDTAVVVGAAFGTKF
jgi:hypothetical protein